MKIKNFKLTLSQYLSLKNINQKDFLTGKSQAELENISRLLNVTLDMKPLEVKREAVKPVKIDLPPTLEEVKVIVKNIQKKEEQVNDKFNQEEIAGNVTKLLEFAKEVVEDEDEIETTSKRKKRN